MNKITKEEVIKNLIKETYRSGAGGQSCGKIESQVTLVSNELGISVSVDNYRSQFKNLDVALEMIRAAYDKINEK